MMSGANRDRWEKVETYVHNDNIVLQPVSLDYDTASFGFEVIQGNLNDVYYSNTKCYLILVPNESCMPQNMPKECLTRGDIWLDNSILVNDNSLIVNGGGYGITNISKEDNPNLDLSKFRFELANKKYANNQGCTIFEWEHPLELERYDYRMVFNVGFWGGRILSLVNEYNYSNSKWGIRTFYPSILYREFAYKDSRISFHDEFHLNTAYFDENVIKKSISSDNYELNYDIADVNKFTVRFTRTSLANGQYIELYRKIKH